ncbi:MAG: hypothetical protein KGK07_09615 [Chloroflexota bacterium]|nr:hypothetical protein [Chloroflexota bacterium]
MALVAALAVLLVSGAPPRAAQAALGGPVIIGGDDLTDHGGVDEGGNPLEGWLYIQRAIENITPNVSRSGNDGSIAALGSAPSNSTCCNAGAAIGVAGAKAGHAVNYFEGAAAINQFFTDLGSGTAKPAIIWIAGTGASNDLDSEERAALADNAAQIAGFVNSGGGLMSHGTAYEWLFALLPNAQALCCGSSDDLYFTPDGTAALPGVTTTDINAGPWHNYFEGDLGGLKVLVRSSSVLDANDNDAAVIIGGASVTLPTGKSSVPVRTATPTSTPAPKATATSVPTTPTSTATAASTVLAAVATPRPAGAVAAGIRAPSTGSGPDSRNGSALTFALLAGAALAAGATLTVAGMRKK